MSMVITTDGPYIRVTLSDRVTNDELQAFARESIRIESDYAVIPHRLTDLSAMTNPDVDFAGVFALATSRLQQRFPNSYKSALVAGDLAHFGLARMFQTLNDHPQITIAIFPDVPSAEAWLAEPGVAPPATQWSPRAT